MKRCPRYYLHELHEHLSSIFSYLSYRNVVRVSLHRPVISSRLCISQELVSVSFHFLRAPLDGTLTARTPFQHTPGEHTSPHLTSTYLTSLRPRLLFRKQRSATFHTLLYCRLIPSLLLLSQPIRTPSTVHLEFLYKRIPNSPSRSALDTVRTTYASTKFAYHRGWGCYEIDRKNEGGPFTRSDGITRQSHASAESR